jgi:hypothetical protein
MAKEKVIKGTRWKIWGEALAVYVDHLACSM